MRHDLLHIPGLQPCRGGAGMSTSTEKPAFIYVGEALGVIRDRRLYRGNLSPADAALFAECEAIIAKYRPNLGRGPRPGIKRSDQRSHNVYVHLAADETVLYVGISLHALTRTGEHKSSGWWQQVASIRIEHLPDRASALAREAELIATLQPLYNKESGR